MAFIKSFLLLVLLTQICVGNEFEAFCDVCRAANEKTECPADLTCAGGVIEYDGIVGTCSGNHIITLKASGMDFEKLPASLNNMTYLQILNAGNNKLKSLPVLDKLTALKTIYIHSNNLESFTGVFVNSRKMEFISAGNNKLTELPPELANMSLKTLNVQNNEIASLPIELKGIKTLVNLDLSQNDFDCSEIRATFSGTIFAEQCIQSQQKTEKDVPGLPLSYSGEPTHAPLDGYEIAAIVLAVLFVCLLIPCVVLYVVYRRRGIST